MKNEIFSLVVCPSGVDGILRVPDVSDTSVNQLTERRIKCHRLPMQLL